MRLVPSRSTLRTLRPPSRRPLPLLPLLLLLLPPPAAEAQRRGRDPAPPPDPAQRARDLYAAEDFEAARAEFERLRDELPDEALWLDVARCLSRLDRPIEAIEAFEKYFAAHAAALDAAARQALDEEIDAEFARIGQLALTVNVEGAEVRIDGRPVGFTPLGARLRLPPGSHVVEVFHPRCADERREVDLAAGQAATIEIATRPPALEPAPTPIAGVPRISALAQIAEEERLEWTGGGWLPIPQIMPWGWARTVPAGGMASVGVGIGDLTETDAFDVVVGTQLLQTMDSALTIPAFLGYRLHAAPMFAVGGYFQYQYQEVSTNEAYGYWGGRGFSLHAGLKLRTYFPLGLLEPFIGFGAGYAHGSQSVDLDMTNTHQIRRTLRGVMLPLELGLDIVPLSFLSAGLWFQYSFGVWLELCIENTRYPNDTVCPDEPGEDKWPANPPDSWALAGHVTFYLR